MSAISAYEQLAALAHEHGWTLELHDLGLMPEDALGMWAGTHSLLLSVVDPTCGERRAAFTPPDPSCLDGCAEFLLDGGCAPSDRALRALERAR